jgi:hypothetical protein
LAKGFGFGGLGLKFGSVVPVHAQLLVPFTKAHDRVAVEGFCWGGQPGARHWPNMYWGETLRASGVGQLLAISGVWLRRRIVIALEMFANRQRSCPLGL